MVVLAAVVALSLVLTGPIVSAVAGPLGFGDTAVTVWNIAKWPVLVVIVLGMIAVLYYSTPNVKLRGFKWVSPGAVLAISCGCCLRALRFYVATLVRTTRRTARWRGSSSS